MKQIRIKVLSNGHIEAETLNYKGHSCQDVLHTIESLTNSKVIDSQYKEDFYDENEEENIINAKGTDEVKLNNQ